MNILVISASLNTDSKSFLMAQEVVEDLKKRGESVELVDLRTLPLPLCDGGASYGHPNVLALSEKISAAHGIIVASPIYNFDVNAALKNVLELTGSGWENKVVGMLGAAGGQASYMSFMAFANSLMLDFRCVIVPRFVYSVTSDFENGAIINPRIRQRIDDLAGEMSRFTRALS